MNKINLIISLGEILTERFSLNLVYVGPIIGMSQEILSWSHKDLNTVPHFKVHASGAAHHKGEHKAHTEHLHSVNNEKMWMTSDLPGLHNFV